jgi:hypothetical protein
MIPESVLIGEIGEGLLGEYDIADSGREHARFVVRAPSSQPGRDRHVVAYANTMQAAVTIALGARHVQCAYEKDLEAMRLCARAIMHFCDLAHQHGGRIIPWDRAIMEGNA